MKTHTFCGRKYDIDLCGKLDGFASQGGKNETMLIMAEGDTKKMLETIIHEALHACNWRAKEPDVLQTGKDIARLLWRLGYRKQDIS
jgi:hypothetical protein